MKKLASLSLTLLVGVIIYSKSYSPYETVEHKYPALDKKKTHNLRILLTDAPNDEVEEVFVNIDHVEILLQGKETEEIMDRPIIGDRYSEGLWIQTLFILQFWANDESKDFEKTDAAIEKAVNVAYDLMGKSPLDSMFDFAKFLFQNR